MTSLDRIQEHLVTLLKWNLSYECYVSSRDRCNADAVGRGFASLLPSDVPVFRVRSDLLRAEEGDLLKQALTNAQVVLMIFSGRSDFAATLVDFWSDYASESGHLSGAPQRHLSFEGISPDQVLSQLIVLHLEQGDSSRPHKAHRLALDADDLAALAELGETAEIAMVDVGVVSASARAGLTMRDLCFLHTRDPEKREKKTTHVILQEGSGPLSWTDLQTLLQGDSADIRIYDGLLRQHRITDDQYGYAVAARDFNHKRRARTSGRGVFSYPDIYEVTWVYEKLVPGRIYRGQFDANWPLETSLLRRKNDGSPLDLEELHRRLSLSHLFLARLREKQEELFGARLTEHDLLAVAQHFGFPTSLMDFTYSFRTAAFFATLDAGKMGEGDTRIGVIYALDYEPELGRESLSGDPGDAIGLDIHELAGVYEGSVERIEPQIPSEDDRIGRQQGLFVRGFSARDLRKVRLSAYYFRQIPGLVFEDERNGVSRNTLLPPETKLTQLSASVWKEFEQQRSALDPLLGQMMLVEPGIMGTQGTIRPHHLASGRRFFTRLRERASAEGETAVSELRDIFTDYFRASRTEANVGVLPEQETQEDPYTPLGRAVSRLVGWSSGDEDQFWKVLRQRLPDSGRREGASDPAADIYGMQWRNRRERIAMACALYFVAWENLRYVHGDEARDLGEEADFLLNQ
jgi:hypothetical protein